MRGQLVRTAHGEWITQPPRRCPNGHTRGPDRVLVGHQACLGHGGGHTTWTCRTCDQTVYGPLLNTPCTTPAGPAPCAKRPPNMRDPDPIDAELRLLGAAWWSIRERDGEPSSC